MIAIEADGEILHPIQDTENNRDLLQLLCDKSLKEGKVEQCEVVEINV